MSKMSIRFYKDREVRAIWDEENSKWWFSVIDIVAVLNEQDDYEKNRNYWKYLKNKLKKNGSELVSATNQLKMTASDGKKYKTDVVDSDGVTELAKNFPSNKSSAFLDWFTYSDNSIDGQSKKKAYTLIESDLVEDDDIGTTRALKQIHAYIFGGLYDFAGKIRSQTISKGGFTFCVARYLNDELHRIDGMPENTFDEIVDKYVEMNVAHPFMEGNGRSTRIWLDQIFKKRLGMCVDWSKIPKEDYLNAMRLSPMDSSLIRKLLKGALTDKIDDREIFMKGIDYSYYYESDD